MNGIRSYKDLIVWQRSMELAREIYRLTKLFPKEELYGIVSQMRRAVVSIPSNIAEGFGRRTIKDSYHFLFCRVHICTRIGNTAFIIERSWFNGRSKI